jgi:flavin-dependent dehydrogenase
MPPVTKHDAVVVGARVAGAATAMLLARAGCDVLVLDRSRYGTDTLSTHELMRPGVLQLSPLGRPRSHRCGRHATRAADRSPLRGPHRRLAVKDAAGVSALYAPRRTLLDAVLVDAAREAGAQFRYATSVVDVVRDRGGRVVAVVATTSTATPSRPEGRSRSGPMVSARRSPGSWAPRSHARARPPPAPSPPTRVARWSSQLRHPSGCDRRP